MPNTLLCASNNDFQNLNGNGSCATDNVELMAYCKYSEIDWSAMQGDVTKFDPTNQVILDFVMVSGAKFKEINPYTKETVAKATYKKSEKSWDNIVSVLLKGQDEQKRLAIEAAIKECGIVVIVWTEKCKGRIYGVDFSPKKSRLELIEMPLEIDNVEDDMGKVGAENSSKTSFDFVGKSKYAPLFHTVEYTDVPF